MLKDRAYKGWDCGLVMFMGYIEEGGWRGKGNYE